MFESRITITFNLMFIKNEMNAEHTNAYASITNFYKNVNIYFHAIFFLNIFLLLIIKRRRKNENKNCRNNNNDENNEEKNDDDKNKRNK